MKKSHFSTLIAFLFITVLVFASPYHGGGASVYAQAAQTATPASTAADLPEDTVSFSQLGLTDTFMYGPYDTLVVDFSTPVDWQLSAGAAIQLTLVPSFTPGTLSTGAASAGFSGGTLSVSYNGTNSLQVPLTWTGEKTITIALPLDALRSTRQDGRQELELFLDAGTDCKDNGRTDVIVKAASFISLPHTYVAPSTRLTDLPKPFYIRSSFAPVPAVVVIPDKPSAAELQAAMITFAGFGHMTQGNLTLSLALAGQVSQATLQTSNLILVGKAADLALLNGLALPAPSDGTQFAAQNAGADDGIVEMAVSPWNKSNVVLVVGGNSDSAVIKAAQAVSSGNLRSGVSADLSLIANVLDSIETLNVTEDRSFADLGYASIMLQGIGLQSTDVTFTVPAGQVAKEGANLQLIFNNSGLIDYNSSGLTVYLNGETIGSQSLTKETASNASVTINIPADLVKQGTNNLTIEVNLDPADNCSLFAQDNLWASFSSSSVVHLPLEPASILTQPAGNLGKYPYPFLANPTLKTTTFVLPEDSPAAWSAAASLAWDLGRRSSGVLTELGAVFSPDLTQEMRAAQDLLVVGQASDLPLVAELRQALPAPFEEGSDLATERAFRVVYNLPAETTIGYLELLPAPWQADRTILAVLGSNPAGLNMAAAALTTSTLRSQLGGDFAVINGTQVLIGDLRLQVGTGNISATVVPQQATPVTAAPEVIQTTVVPAPIPAWIEPSIMAIGAAILVILVGLAWFALRRKKG